MKACDYCGKDLNKWSLGENRILECGMCVQARLVRLYPAPQIPAERRERSVAARTANAAPRYTGRPWDTVKNPIKWSDML